MRRTVTTEPGVVDAWSLAAHAADELVLATVRDTHSALTERVAGIVRRTGREFPAAPRRVHDAVSSSVYAGLGLGLRAASRGLDAAGAAGLGPRLEAGPRGRAVRSVVNGLIGERVTQEHPRLAIPMALRVGGVDVAPTRSALTEAYPDPTTSLTIFVHGLSESEANWDRQREQQGRVYADTVSEAGWTPVFVRVNTGLPLRANGVALASLLDQLSAHWPVEVERIMLIGHSMGGLIVRSACAVVAGEPTRRTRPPWADLVTEVITLGTPHLGAPLARRVGDGSRLLARLPETAAFGRVLDWRSVGVHDLVEGFDDVLPALPNAHYRLVSATLTRNPRHPVGRIVGDLLVRVPSAQGRGRGSLPLFPEAELLHVPASNHFDLLNHPDVHESLRRWSS